ncbi:uncharacterized protein LOC131248264 [Magnolia sinica]|uniref:uncharacterized protein LOC131248264 n=1 Tax=Magnolia sinica TaxID=86752 RepID=UPI0026592C16|nr:uncharacterized protein LOC131248264 [Magnolia sinica]
MVDNSIVCCMCGDVGFPDKLFRCTGCRSRFQHLYCSNYYDESLPADSLAFCDWCHSKERSVRHAVAQSKRSAEKNTSIIKRSEYSGDKIKRHDREESSDRGKNVGSAPSPRRRYKFLKDVMC